MLRKQCALDNGILCIALELGAIDGTIGVVGVEDEIVAVTIGGSLGDISKVKHVVLRTAYETNKMRAVIRNEQLYSILTSYSYGPLTYPILGGGSSGIVDNTGLV